MGLQQRFLWQLSAKGYQDKVAFLTDGRLSGTNKGCAIAHISPEAASGGPLAIIEEGDIIEIDVANRELNMELSPEEIEERLKTWKPTPTKTEPGFLSIYSKMANPADKGSALNYKE
jgi:dihydroxy-acid dehydratase